MRFLAFLLLISFAGCVGAPDTSTPEGQQEEHPFSFFPISTIFDYKLQYENQIVGQVTIKSESNTVLQSDGAHQVTQGISFEIQYNDGPSWTLFTSVDETGNVTNGKWSCENNSTQDQVKACGSNTDQYGLDFPGMHGLPGLLGAMQATSWPEVTSNECKSFQKPLPLFTNLSSILTPLGGTIEFCYENALPTRVQQGNLQLVAVEDTARQISINFENASTKNSVQWGNCNFTYAEEGPNSLSSKDYMIWANGQDPFFSDLTEIEPLPSFAYSHSERGDSFHGSFRFRGPLVFFHPENGQLHLRTMVKVTEDNQLFGVQESYEPSEEESIIPLNEITALCPKNTPTFAAPDNMTKALKNQRLIFKNIAPNLGLGWQGGAMAKEPFRPLLSLGVPSEELDHLSIHDPRVFKSSQAYQPYNEDFGFQVGFLKAGLSEMDGSIYALQRDGWQHEA